MKKSIIMIMAVLAIQLTSCVKNLEKEGIHVTTLCKGRVIEKSENAPIQGVTVSVSDGTHVHASSTTNDEGRFELEVNFNELNENYSLCLECLNYPSMTEALKGMGQEVFDYRDIVFFDKENTTDWPVVTTKEVSYISSNAAKSGGTIAYTGTAPITARGVCWGTIHDPTIEDNHSSDGTGIGEFTSNITNLDLNTKYYVRAYATNLHGTFYGNELSFTTANGLPTVVLDENSFEAIPPTSISCSSNVTSNGGYHVTGKGVCWNTLPMPTINNSHTNDGSGSGYYVSAITDLNSTNTYYIRAYATNAAGTAYSEQYVMTADHLNYLFLPRFQYQGYTYVVYPDDGTTYSFSQLDNYTGITLDGYWWYLPDEDELLYMYQHKQSIGGFSNTHYWYSAWLSWGGSQLSRHGCIDFRNGIIYDCDDDNRPDNNRIRLIRIEY